MRHKTLDYQIAGHFYNGQRIQDSLGYQFVRLDVFFCNCTIFHFERLQDHFMFYKLHHF